MGSQKKSAFWTEIANLDTNIYERRALLDRYTSRFKNIFFISRAKPGTSAIK